MNITDDKKEEIKREIDEYFSKEHPEFFAQFKNEEEEFVFLIKNDNDLCHVSLSKMLECVLISIFEGGLPPIDEKWWDEVEKIYSNIKITRANLKSTCDKNTQEET